MNEITRQYVAGGHYDQALQVANATKSPYYTVTTLSEIAGRYVQVGQEEILSLALQMANSMEAIPGVFPSKENALVVVAGAYAEAGYYDKAFNIASAIDISCGDQGVLVDIAARCLQAGQREYVPEFLPRILQTAQAAEEQSLQVSQLTEIATIYTHAGQKEEAARVLSDALEVAKKHDLGGYAVADIVSSYMEAGNYDEALAVTQGIERAFARD